VNDEFEEFDIAAESADEEPEAPAAESADEEPEALAAESIEGLSGAGADALTAARDEAERLFLPDPLDSLAAMATDGPAGLGNVVGVGIGEKYSGGHPTGQSAVKVFVKEKLSSRRVSAAALVPETIGGAETDVEVIGEIDAQMFTQRRRPAPGGVSIGHCSVVHAGTLGCLVRKGNRLFVLSNNHVIALTNAAPIGSRIPQPGRLDGGVCPADVIAALAQFIPITFNQGVCNFVDAAIGKANPQLVDRRILRPGRVLQPLVAPHGNPVLNRRVQKSGRTTQYTRGFIAAVNVTVNINYGSAQQPRLAKFCRQFMVRGVPGPFSRPGDSGSLVTTFPANRPVGLLFAGNASTNTTFCNPIAAVLGALGVQIVY